MKKLTLVFFLTMLLSIASQAQEKTDSTKQKRQRKVYLFGSVCDSFTKAAVEKPFITVMNEDSTVVDTITASTYKDWGSQMNRTDFRIKVPAVATKYIIRAQAPEYEDLYLDYEIKYVARNAYFNLPMLEMQKRYAYDKELDEVEVVATKVQMVIKGDTIIYNADAFNVPEGSMLDGLIRQMPGVELSDDGVITVNGRKIDRLTLNGDDFMKGNNNAMLQNLPHYTVKDVQVYDKLSDKDEYLGHQTEQKEFVMNVRMKREYSRGYIANAEVGAGTEGRYMTRMFALAYGDKTRVSVFGNMNNVNERRRPGSDGDWDATKEPNGITNVKNMGLDINTKSRDGKADNSFEAEVKWQKDDNESRVAGDNYLNGTSNYSRSNSLSTARNSNLQLSNYFKRNDKVHINSEAQINIGRGNSNSLSRQTMLSENPAIYGDVVQVLDSIDAKVPGLMATGINKTYTQGYSRNKSLSMTSNSWLVKKLPWGDELIFGTNMAYGNNGVFIFDPNDASNRPVAGKQDHVVKLWEFFPQYVKDAFIRSFTVGMGDPAKRLIENEWQKLFIRLRAEILTCICGAETFCLNDLTPAGTCRCPACGREYAVLEYNSNSIKAPIYCGYKMRVCELDPHFSNTEMVVGEVVENRRDRGNPGIKNCSPLVWRARLPDGKVYDVVRGKGMPVWGGLHIEIGNTHARVMQPSPRRIK